jgi:hypothetical protein
MKDLLKEAHHGLTCKQARNLAYEYARCLPRCKYPNSQDKNTIIGLIL